MHYTFPCTVCAVDAVVNIDILTSKIVIEVYSDSPWARSSIAHRKAKYEVLGIPCTKQNTESIPESEIDARLIEKARMLYMEQRIKDIKGDAGKIRNAMKRADATPPRLQKKNKYRRLCLWIARYKSECRARYGHEDWNSACAWAGIPTEEEEGVNHC